MPAMSDVTHILTAIEQGDPQAADKLLPLVYEELRKLAAHKMANEAAGQTLQPTALVHEAWIRLVGKENPPFKNRAHFFGAEAEAMPRFLVESARSNAEQRHGGGKVRVDIEQINLASPSADEQLLAVHGALDNLAVEHPEEAELVKLRYFVGMTLDEVAAVLGISPRTADNYWVHARAWLLSELKDRSDSP